MIIAPICCRQGEIELPNTAVVARRVRVRVRVRVRDLCPEEIPN
jgi:hypothetical protein